FVRPFVRSFVRAVWLGSVRFPALDLAALCRASSTCRLSTCDLSIRTDAVEAARDASVGLDAGGLDAGRPGRLPAWRRRWPADRLAIGGGAASAWPVCTGDAAVGHDAVVAAGGLSERAHALGLRHGA